MISTFTGTPTWEQKVWIAVLHAGGGTALVAGLTALKCHGLRNWDRDEITVIVDDEAQLRTGGRRAVLPHPRR